jgi:hypothetical protein
MRWPEGQPRPAHAAAASAFEQADAKGFLPFYETVEEARRSPGMALCRRCLLKLADAPGVSWSGGACPHRGRTVCGGKAEQSVRLCGTVDGPMLAGLLQWCVRIEHREPVALAAGCELR